MANASFMQTSFLGGEWSNYSQGRMDSDRWKTALNVCLNSYPLEEGSWTRRQGTRFLATTKGGLAAKLLRFEYSVAQPFQAELGAEYARFFFGQSQVFTDDEQEIVSISSASPAVVTVGTHGWSDDEQVMIFFTSGIGEPDHSNAPTLRNRQFYIDVLSATTFALYDAVTGDAIDGSTLNYTAPGGTVKRIFEIETPYVGSSWSGVRALQNEDEVLWLHAEYAPRILTVSDTVLAPFALATASFLDGPYMTVNTTATTLDPSGVSGSVTLVASSTTGINDGQGFLTTDVGRLIRLFWEPAAWSSASTYAIGDLVKYNDQYFVNIKATAASAPTPERDITSWSIATDAVVWTWGRITARASTTSVTFLIVGDDLPDATARLTWRLGLYSDTTGWPTCGRFHDGRLWLSGVEANRVDASKANSINGFFDFEPTLADGTVADDNAISAIAHSDDRNKAVWMTTDDDGLFVGTEGGEWRGRASVNNDPISPSNFDLRRVTKYKCYDAEPAVAPNKTLFIQLQRRKVMEWGYFPSEGFKASHLSLTGRHLTTSGLVEIVYQNEPIPMVWARREDGVLIGAAYKRDPEEGYYAAWHKVTLGEDRTVVSISVGASLSALSEALWVITNGGNGVHFVEILTPVFEDDTEGWLAFYVDSGITPQSGVVSGSDIIFYGFWPLVGTDVSVVINGIDVGDFTVAADGSITVPIGATDSGYTLADLQTLSDAGVDYGDLTITIDIGAGASPPDETGNIMANIGDDDEVVDVTGTSAIVNTNRDRMFIFMEGPAATAGIRAFHMTDDGAEYAQNNIEGIFGAGSGRSIKSPVSQDMSGYMYFGSTGYANSVGISKIDPVTLTALSHFGANSGAVVANGTGVPLPTSSCVVRSPDGYDFHVSSAIVTGDVSFVNVTDMVWGGQSLDVDEARSKVCAGAEDTGVAWGLGVAAVYPSAAAVGLYKFLCDTGSAGWVPTSPITAWATAPNTNITKTKMGTVTPAEVDATWTRFLAVSQPLFDRTDGNVIVLIQGDDGATTKDYVVKLDVANANVLWATEINNATATISNECYIDDDTFAFLSSETTAANVRPVYLFDTSTGVAATQSWSGVQPNGGQVFDSISGSITVFGIYSDIAGTFPAAEVGDYFDTHVTDTFSNEWMRIWPTAPQASGTAQLRVYNRIPGVVGYTYTSRGQLLRPDYGNDAGVSNGPSFGSVRRIHKYAAYVLRARGVSFGIDFDTSLRPAPLKNPDGTDLDPGELYTGAFEDTMDADYDLEGKIAWEITRPYPATVTVVAGYLAGQNK